jgi:hypothetical protein
MESMILLKVFIFGEKKELRQYENGLNAMI